jgi:hypothetical protein
VDLPLPVPTMTDSGVARASARGQAMIGTATADTRTGPRRRVQHRGGAPGGPVTLMTRDTAAGRLPAAGRLAGPRSRDGVARTQAEGSGAAELERQALAGQRRCPFRRSATVL